MRERGLRHPYEALAGFVIACVIMRAEIVAVYAGHVWVAMVGGALLLGALNLLDLVSRKAGLPKRSWSGVGVRAGLAYVLCVAAMVFLAAYGAWLPAIGLLVASQAIHSVLYERATA